MLFDRDMCGCYVIFYTTFVHGVTTHTAIEYMYMYLHFDTLAWDQRKQITPWQLLADVQGKLGVK